MSRPEDILIANIQRELGALPGVIVYRNAVGKREVVDEDKSWWLSYGLGDGTPDLVFSVQLDVVLTSGKRASIGRLVGLETKSATGTKRASQVRVQKQWHQVGNFYAFVRSVEQARAALERAREGALE
jgi:hypothetical protein